MRPEDTSIFEQRESNVRSYSRAFPAVYHRAKGSEVFDAAGRRYLDLGFHISLSGVVTYKKTEALQDAVRFTPLDRLMVETDSPFLAPVPHRGRKNEPAHFAATLARCPWTERALLALRDVVPVVRSGALELADVQGR